MPKYVSQTHYAFLGLPQAVFALEMRLPDDFELRFFDDLDRRDWYFGFAEERDETVALAAASLDVETEALDAVSQDVETEALEVVPQDFESATETGVWPSATVTSTCAIPAERMPSFLAAA